MSQVTYAERIRQAKGIPEAMLIIAEGIDEVLAARPLLAEDQWGTWGDGGTPVVGTQTIAHLPVPDVEFYAKRQAAPNPAHVAAAQERVARLEDMYGRTPTPQVQGLLDQAYAALSAAEKPGEYLDHSGGVVGDADLLRPSETEDGGVIVDLPPVDDHRKALRRKLAETIDLPGFFPPIMRSSAEAVEQILHSYELGGPLWLYANRITPDEHDIFQQLPPQAKTLMVADVAVDSQRMAWEFQRDIMKDEDAEGATLGIAQDNLNGIIGGPRVGLMGGGD
jgi:hypothetical protein